MLHQYNISELCCKIHKKVLRYRTKLGYKWHRVYLTYSLIRRDE